MSGTAALSDLKQDAGRIKGVGDTLRAYLGDLGIHTIEDLLYHFPRRYLDRSKLARIVDVREGETVTVVGKVVDVREFTTANRRRILNVGISDSSSVIFGVWFNQPYHAARLQAGTTVAFSGKTEFRYGKFQMVNPAYDILDESGDGSEAIHTGRIIPLHPASAQLSSARLRRLIWNALEALPEISDPLPPSILARYHLPGRAEALRAIHFPSGREPLVRARRRMIFEELMVIQTGLALFKRRRESELQGIAYPAPGQLIQEFTASLPFQLTQSQRRAFAEIAGDMHKPFPMNRLLQGEVGSGKTLVALLALLLAVQGGRQGALMAPTEVLAEQHYRTITGFLTGMPAVKVELLTGGARAASRKESLRRITGGEVDLVVGTHALIQEEVVFADLGLAVVDEQHRFGVRQRVMLKAKGEVPDVLIMTATPIPRTLSLTLYGDLEISTLTELPAGRGEVITKALDADQRESAYALMEREMDRERQIFVVCPLVESSPRLEAKAAEAEARALRKRFAGRSVGLLHGQMRKEDKDNAMQDFRDHRTQLLVATTVIEVGIDIPNASVMLVENADRFGLSQLHQLRGRIGRGGHRSYAIFIFEGKTPESQARRKAIEQMRDGFRLAEADLEMRGEGQLFGARQSGLPDLRIAKLRRDMKILLAAREEAFRLVSADPQLRRPEHRLLREEVQSRFAGTGQLEWLFHS